MGNTLVKYDLGSPEEVFRRVWASLEVRRSIGETKEAFLKAEKEAVDLNYQCYMVGYRAKNIGVSGIRSF